VVTGSFDKTAKIWDAGTGVCCCTLKGKCIAGQLATSWLPTADVATQQAAGWCAAGPTDLQHFLLTCDASVHCWHDDPGHDMEIVCLAFNPQSTQVATGSMDHTSKVSDHLED